MSYIKSLILFFILVSLNCYADSDQFVLDGALGVFNTKGSSLSQDKFAKLGVQEDLWFALKQRFNVGGWLDNRGPNYANTAFGGYQLGFEVSNDVLQASIWTGPTLLTATDSQLGGLFQFNETIFFGIKDRDYESIGIVYNHFSSAGIENPNIGRDFMGLEIKMPF